MATNHKPRVIYVVTCDKDLLSLRNDVQFTARYPDMTILAPSALRRAVEGN